MAGSEPSLTQQTSLTDLLMSYSFIHIQRAAQNTVNDLANHSPYVVYSEKYPLHTKVFNCTSGSKPTKFAHITEEDYRSVATDFTDKSFNINIFHLTTAIKLSDCLK